MTDRIRTSVELHPGQSEQLQAIAAALGLLQTRGVGAGTVGSIAQLMQAIARGDLRVERVDNPNLKNEQTSG